MTPPIPNPRHAPRLWPALLLAATLAGCAWKGGAAAGPADRFNDPNAWTPAPVSMRVYPSSKFSSAGGKAIFEARIEFRDAMDDSIKAVGQFHFELLTADKSSRADAGRSLYNWDVPLLTLAQQKQYYDPITRAYLFRLKLDEPLPPRQITTFRATLTPSQGAPLQAEEIIKPSP